MNMRLIAGLLGVGLAAVAQGATALKCRWDDDLLFCPSKTWISNSCRCFGPQIYCPTGARTSVTTSLRQCDTPGAQGNDADGDRGFAARNRGPVQRIVASGGCGSNSQCGNNFDVIDSFLSDGMVDPTEQSRLHGIIKDASWQVDLPGDVVAVSELLNSEVSAWSGDVAGAQRALETALNTNLWTPAERSVRLLQHAELNLRLGRAEAVRAGIEQYEQLVPNGMIATARLKSAALSLQGQYQQATQVILGVPRESRSFEHQEILKSAYLEQGEYAGVSNVLEEQLQTHPRDAMLTRELASMYAISDEHARLTALVQRAEEDGLIASEEDFRFYGKLLHGAAEPLDAAAFMERGARKFDVQDDPDFLKQLGDAYYLGGEDAKALDIYERRERIPSAGIDLELNERWRGLLFEAGRYDEAKRIKGSLLDRRGRDARLEQGDTLRESDSAPPASGRPVDTQPLTPTPH